MRLNLAQITFFLVYLVALNPCSLAIQAQSTQPNILLIIADDLGNDALRGFGFDDNIQANTPNLDQLRQDGISYLQTWATPQCTPTRSAVMSGKYGVKTGVMRPPGNLDLEHQSIFSYIKEKTNDAYATAVIGKWHISNPINTNHPIEHGADHYEGVIDGTIDDYYDWEKVEDGSFVQSTEYITTELTNDAISWIEDQSKPWFVWMAHIAPHSPFQLPPDGSYSVNNPTNNRQLYQASIEALDFEIGRLLSSMDQSTKENTIFIFVGDNGTPNGVLQSYPNGHGKGTLYEGGIRVPLIISGSGVTRSGQVENGLTQLTDLYATIAELTTGDELPGGIHNSYSLKSSINSANTIARTYVYSDYEDDGTQQWAIRNERYKLIQNENGNQEFYKIEDNLNEDVNLIGSLSSTEAEILAELAEEAMAIRNGWSCNDFIQNGEEDGIDSCGNSSSCNEVDVLSNENIGCCESPTEPSVYYEYEEEGSRNIYTNGFPNHDYCFNPINIPEQAHHFYRIPLAPAKANAPTAIVRNNGRPARNYGVALNGVQLSPAPGTPFIFTNANTGEFNWDWVYEPTNNQGNGMDQVRLDCATAHTNAAGYHYHGEMFEYLETKEPGITEDELSKVFQIGWAADGYPIVYKFGPDATGTFRELLPSYQLRSGERPGDGITAPCGPYTGKYTVDYEYVNDLGDLDECNGMNAQITLNTCCGSQTFEYFYVVTSGFPQIGRCLVGTPSPDFDINAPLLTGMDQDGDGYLSDYDCDDRNANINPTTIDIPNNGSDEDCDGEDTNILLSGIILTSAESIGDGVEISWTVENELSSGTYLIQHSDRHADFRQIGTTEITASDQYSFVDFNPVTGTNYYRIGLEQPGGNLIYSDILAAEWSISSSTTNVSLDELHIFPNPTSGDISTSLGVISAVYNSLGQKLNTQDNYSEIPKGVYFAKVLYQKENYIRRFIKI